MISPRILLTVLLSFTLIHHADAAYLKDVPQRLAQPDGSILNCLATGDEFHNWLHDSNNYTIIQDPSTGYYVYATKSGKNLVPTALIAGRSDPASANLKPGVNLDPDEILRLSREKFIVPQLKGATGAATTGTINNIVIFIRFSDQPEFSTGISTYNSAFNTAGAISLTQYFLNESKSQLTINSTLYPSNSGTGSVVSYQDANPRSYYCKYDASTNTNGYSTDAERQTREMTLVKNAALLVKSQLESSGLDFDNDNDGRIDNICYIVQGSAQGWNDLLWPHMWALFEFDVRISGARIWNFNFQLSNSFGVSVLCHEMSHSIGFPDLYRYNSELTPVGKWDVMGSNTSPPQQHSAYTKERYGHWFSGIPEISTDGVYTLSPLSTDGYAAYKIKSPNSTTEYFVVEYRKREGLFESALPGSGLIISRITPSITGNSQGPPDEVYVMRPNGWPTVNGDINTAYFSHESGRTEFNSNSNPSCHLSNGLPGAIEISNIGNAGSTITFSVAIGAALPVLNVSPSTREMGMSGGTTFYDVNNLGGGNMDWSAEVTSGSSWLHITSGATGTNNGSIIVIADVNNERILRTGVITITSPGSKDSPETVSLIQLADPPILSINPSSKSIGCDADTASFKVSNTGIGILAWSAAVTSGASWLHVTSGTSGGNSGIVMLSADSNLESSIRTGIVTVTAAGADGSPKTFTIVQGGNPPVLLVLPDSLKFGFPGGSAGFEIINMGRGTMPWITTITTGSSWIHLLSDPSGSDYGTIDISVDKNPADSLRTGNITINANGAVGSPMTVAVEQSANTTLGSGLLINEEMSLKVYPNPAMNDLTILLDRSVSWEGRLVITDMLGRVMFSARSKGVGPFKTHIDVSHWTRGCYQVSMDAGTQYLRKLVILQ